jgi:PleD family two-component response regulator
MQTILVVDDQAESRKPLVRLLQMEGYRVISAANAFEAMGAAKKEHPNLILLDVMIPPHDGLTFLMLLRDDLKAREVPVFLITGLSDAQTVARGKELGVKEHLVKTHFTPDQLIELVRKHISPAAQPAADSAK